MKITHRSGFHVAANGWQLVKIKVRHPMDVDTMKNMLIQVMHTIVLGGHNRSILLGVSFTMLRNAEYIRFQRQPLKQIGE